MTPVCRCRTNCCCTGQSSSWRRRAQTWMSAGRSGGGILSSGLLWFYRLGHTSPVVNSTVYWPASSPVPERFYTLNTMSEFIYSFLNKSSWGADFCLLWLALVIATVVIAIPALTLVVTSPASPIPIVVVVLSPSLVARRTLIITTPLKSQFDVQWIQHVQKEEVTKAI